MQKVIIEDTREKQKAVELINKQLEENGYVIIRSKLYCGDYQLIDNPYLVIDRKQNLQELIGNVTHDHQRFKAEIERANDIGVHVTVLVEHSKYIKKQEDLKYWYNPRIKNNPKATKGNTLLKILDTLSMIYDVDFVFCSKKETGIKIIELLEKGAIECQKKQENLVT